MMSTVTPLRLFGRHRSEPTNNKRDAAITMARFKVRKLINSRYGLHREAGRIVCEAVISILRRGEFAEVDYAGMAALTPQFLSMALGAPSETMPWEQYRERLRLLGLPTVFAALFEAVITVWKGIQPIGNGVLRNTEAVKEVAYLMTPFEKRPGWTRSKISLIEPVCSPSNYAA